MKTKTKKIRFTTLTTRAVVVPIIGSLLAIVICLTLTACGDSRAPNSGAVSAQVVSNQPQDSPGLVRFIPEPERFPTIAPGRSPPIPAPAVRSAVDAPAGFIQLPGISLSQALAFYGALTDAELFTEPRVQKLRVTIYYTNSQDFTHSEFVRSFEEALHQQAGLVFEHQGARRIAIRLATTNSVTK